MSLLAHATFAASGLEAERRNLDATVRHEAAQRALQTQREALRAAAEDDFDRACKSNVDLNPFTTTGMRHLWQCGWSGHPLPHLNVEGSLNWRAWERGRQARAVVDAQVQPDRDSAGGPDPQGRVGAPRRFFHSGFRAWYVSDDGLNWYQET